MNKKLSYRRETARQLPTWRGARPSSPLPLRTLWLYIYAYGRIWNPPQKYVQRARAVRTLSWIGIQGHSRLSLFVPAGIQNDVLSSCAINADLISETYEDTPTGTQQIRRFQRPHSSLKTSQQATPSNIYKWFIFIFNSPVMIYIARNYSFFIPAADSMGHWNVFGLHSLVFT